MKRSGVKRILNLISYFQIIIIFTFILSVSFIISETNIVSSQQLLRPHNTNSYTLGKTWFKIDDRIVRWDKRGEGNIRIGTLANGEVMEWDNIDPSIIDDVTNLLSNDEKRLWTKTFDFKGNEYSFSEALTEYGNIPGFVNSETGQLTDEALEALDGVIKNPFIDASGALASSSLPGYSYEVPVLGFEITNFLGGHLVQGLVWAGAVIGAIQLAGNLFGADEDTINSLSIAAGAGILGGKAAFGLFGESTSTTGAGIFSESFSLTSTQATYIGIGIGVAVFLATYKKESKDLVQFQCLPYEPPLGGNSCESCNDDEFRPCSEYRCRSLGQACEIVNPGTLDEKCVWVSPQDVNSPTITPWDEALSNDHSYVSHDSRPPALGTKIIRDGATDGCIAAFTALEFGFETNEPAQCKVSDAHTDNLDDMLFFFGESNLFLEEHEQKLRLPSPDSLNIESPELENDGIYDFFVRCQDKNGNVNEDEFVFNFCVDPSPDTTPPIIEGSSINNGGAVAYEVDEIEVLFYINEPAQCAWSTTDKDYSEMENSMACSSSVAEINADLVYPCEATLNGIEDNSDNTYYVRCKDQPNKEDSERNVNTQSYVYTLQGTQPLDIIEYGPNETAFGSATSIEVELFVKTSNGADEGNAICYFSPSGSDGSFVKMFETEGFDHSQILSLSEGNYDYFFRCIDDGGNLAEENTEFYVEVDDDPPAVTRAYKELDALKIVTDEDASCVYSLGSCNYAFSDGIPMTLVSPTKRTNHFVPWDESLIYYIKCSDDFSNQPAGNDCSIVASASTVG